MSIRVSAIICTHNRSDYLRQAIQSLADQTLPTEQYEVIVVDNGSTDNTRAVVEGFDHIANLRYVYEPILGLSQARNTGWQNARGEYIAFMDDDAIGYPTSWKSRWQYSRKTLKWD
ncbi:MAG: glycosyltransferase family A protein [Dehalococcoidia bacterium]